MRVDGVFFTFLPFLHQNIDMCIGITMTTIRSIIEKLQVYNPDDTIENLLQDPGVRK